ncbi:MAG: signal peptidase I [Polyangiaceae bacterium]
MNDDVNGTSDEGSVGTGAPGAAVGASDVDGGRRTAAHGPSGSRILRTIYWGTFFVFAPIALASLLVWALSPPSGVEHGGVLGTIEGVVRDQPVPVAILSFMVFGLAMWRARYHLPLASHAHPPLRSDVPERLRTPFDRARNLLDEADQIQEARADAIKIELSEATKKQLRDALVSLRSEMERVPFVEEHFVDAFVRADGEVSNHLGRWRKSEAREYVESIVIAVLLALGLRSFVFEAFKIPSGSMIPTLQVGDHIFVNKSVYGPAIPWTQSRAWSRMPPERGDVIVFAFPEKPEQDFIKRVIALPGDKLEAKNGHPWINGWEVPSCLVGTYSYPDAEAIGGKREGDLFVEFLEDEAFLSFYDHAASSFNEVQGPFFVKPGEVMVMGDNRHNSHDSRLWWGGRGGGVPFENIRGRALFVWLSVADGAMDWSRLGAPVMGRPRVPPAMKALEPGIEKCLKGRPSLDKTTPPKAAP